MIWIPYIIFKNTDDDEAVKVDYLTEDIRTKVSVRREQNFTRSGPEVADEVTYNVSFFTFSLSLITRLRYSVARRT